MINHNFNRKKIFSSLPLMLAPGMPRLAFANQNKMVPSVKRLVCVGFDLSLRPENFIPQKSGWDVPLSPLLKPLASVQNDLTVFSGLHHHGVSGGHAAVHAFLSGIKKNQASSYSHGNISMDQVLAKHEDFEKTTRFSSLALSIGGGPISWDASSMALPSQESSQLMTKWILIKKKTRLEQDLGSVGKIKNSTTSLMVCTILKAITASYSWDSNHFPIQDIMK